MTDAPDAVLVTGREDWEAGELPGAVETLENAGFRIEPLVADEDRPLGECAREAVGRSTDRIVAAGGDGTLNGVVAAIWEAGAGRRTLLGLVPSGTANDFAGAAGLPIDDPTGALSLALRGEGVPIDLALANGRPFLNVGSGGAATRFTREASSSAKQVLGKGAYLLSALQRWDELEPQPIRLSSPGFEWEGEALFVGLGNARTAGGGMPVAPRALVDDGELDLLIVPSADEFDWRDVVADLIREGAEEARERFITARLVRAHLSAPGGLELNLDGEPYEAEAFEFTVEPGALNMVLPEQCPLLVANASR